MTAPATHVVEIGFSADVLDNPSSITWTDITSYARNISIRRGNTNYMIRNVEAGTCTITLNDFDSRFISMNQTGPYYPNVKSGKPVRVRTTFDGNTETIFYGMTARWEHDYQVGTNDQVSTVRLSCTDLMPLLAEVEVDQTLLGANGQLVAFRIALLLADTGPNSTRTAWPSYLQFLAANGTALIEQDAAGRKKVLDAIKLAVDSEWGLFFMARDGVATFYPRTVANPARVGAITPYYWFTADLSHGYSRFVDEIYQHVPYAYNESGVTYNSGGTTQTPDMGTFDDIQIETDDQNLVNLVEVVDAYGQIGGWKNPPSITTSGERPISVDTLLPDVSDAETLAEVIMNNQYNGELRVRRLGWHNNVNDESTTCAHTVDLVDTVGIYMIIPGTSAELFGVVTAIEHSITPETWYTELTFGSGVAAYSTSNIGEAL